MEVQDIKRVVSIIQSHEEFDGLCAGRYYDEYFKRGDVSDKEENYVAVDNDANETVGVCGYSPDKYLLPDIVWLNWFYVDKNYQAKGVG